MRATKVRGKVWMITASNGKPIDNIDTDMIFHNSHLHITQIAEMGPLAFGNLDGWIDFPKKCQMGDILVAGKNFGAGSSRQQAVDCFAALGVTAIVAESFGAIYKRNAINSGMALIEAPNIFTDGTIKSGDTIELDYESGRITAKAGDFQAKPMSQVQKDIFLAGNLFAYGKKA